jgi:hypothetical protein
MRLARHLARSFAPTGGINNAEKNTMSRQGTFKKPTTKDTSRAYVRLFGYFVTPKGWTEFLQLYRVEPIAVGMQL